jgi:SHS family lactate transporter-like MFS transporter
MTYAARSSTAVPWRREPTRDQWYAFIAAWLGWTLDAFDFTVFLFLWGKITSFMLPKLKSDEFSFVFLRRLRFGDGRRPIAL